MKDRFILDSSIWIAIERKNTKILQRVLPLISKNQVCIVDIIAAEVLRGVKTRSDFDKLQESFVSFRNLRTNWLDVAALAFETARAGFHPPLADLYIAQCAIENQRTIITQDIDFINIAKVRAFDVELLKQS